MDSSGHQSYLACLGLLINLSLPKLANERSRANTRQPNAEMSILVTKQEWKCEIKENETVIYNCLVPHYYHPLVSDTAVKLMGGAGLLWNIAP